MTGVRRARGLRRGNPSDVRGKDVAIRKRDGGRNQVVEDLRLPTCASSHPTGVSPYRVTHMPLLDRILNARGNVKKSKVRLCPMCRIIAIQMQCTNKYKLVHMQSAVYRSLLPGPWSFPESLNTPVATLSTSANPSINPRKQPIVPSRQARLQHAILSNRPERKSCGTPVSPAAGEWCACREADKSAMRRPCKLIAR